MTRAPTSGTPSASGRRPGRLTLTALLCAAALVLTVPGVAAAQDDPPPAPVTTWNGATPKLSTPWTAEVGPDNALPEYPRPQLARPTAADPSWTNLNGLWQYSASDGFSPPPVGQDLDGEILVPYPPESVLSGVEEHSDYMYYRRTVDVPREQFAGRNHVRLNFGAVNHDATVWVNGIRVARHTGGYDAFSADITRALRRDQAQEIIVGVHSPVDGANIPVGKQRLNPGGIFYTAASGIWQTAWLEPVPETSIASLTATPNLANSTMRIENAVNGDQRGRTIRVDVFDGAKRVSTASGPAGLPLTVRINSPRLWSPDDPFLYTIKARLTGPGRNDAVESYAGMRSIDVEEVAGKQRIVLNGEPTFLLSTLDQGYWPDGIHTAPTDEAMRFDLEKTKDLGFNTVRKHIKVEPARWYYEADRLGLMVWQDMPSLPTGRNGNLSTGDRANFRNETRRMVDQLKGVTSIIGWIPFNEGWGQWSVAAASEVGAQVKAQDPSRLVNDRSGSNCCDTPGDPGTGDIIDWHQYTGPALPAPDATRASIDGEHGGYALALEGHLWPVEPIAPYGFVADTAELNQRYEENTGVLRDQGAPYGLSGAVYTQITDVEAEVNGFYTYDRRVEKVDEARVRAVNEEVIAAGVQPAPTPPPGTPGLDGVHRWTFDEGEGTTAADSAGTAPLTLENGAGWTPGVAGQALQLNGTDQYATAGEPLIDTQGTNYSVSAWVRLDKADGAFQTVVSEDSDTNSAFFLQYAGADRRFAFSFADVRALAADAGEPEVGRWYHLVGVRNVSTSALQIYVDGTLAGSRSVLSNADVGTGELVVGRGQFRGGPVDYLAGSLDDTRVYDRALSADEVAQLYAAVPQPAG